MPTKKVSSAKTEKNVLNVKNRDVFGKKLKKFRHSGQLPANIYGPDFKSQSVSVLLKDFIGIYRLTHETGIVYLQLDSQEIPVLIRHLQRHPVSDSILHVDFRKIDLKKKIQTEVPVKTINTSEAVSQKSGVLLTLSETLLVEALPEDIPQSIEVDISVIKDIGQEIKVAELPKSDKYEIKTPSDKVVISVVAHKEESITPETTVTAPEVITEVKPEGEDSGEAASTEGSKKSFDPAQGKPGAESETAPAEKKEDKK
ncbi:MAG: 50S ribosomal protein L25 [Candidatus Roizmanbacteria bacterium GW2011_GWA2_36_23]|uniref:Large ribosomal subunit protein bL25 n=1 Tax=Candidatus Roizmanbacteria bacterium GW2011_GWA2_36_23 TaxID=1618480 RepID=A0A0G0HDV0_9BACT|nr:MAG: 50S ribosomal protein L25 [Candidatus Roizmanbacteria bacterium GW2011_GWA2_36_23]